VQRIATSLVERMSSAGTVKDDVNSNQRGNKRLEVVEANVNVAERTAP
jgi:hypothetical protein